MRLPLLTPIKSDLLLRFVWWLGVIKKCTPTRLIITRPSTHRVWLQRVADGRTPLERCSDPEQARERIMLMHMRRRRTEHSFQVPSWDFRATERRLTLRVAFIKTGWTWIARITHQAATARCCVSLLRFAMNTLKRAFNLGARTSWSQPSAQIETLWAPGCLPPHRSPDSFCISLGLI